MIAKKDKILLPNLNLSEPELTAADDKIKVLEKELERKEEPELWKMLIDANKFEEIISSLITGLTYAFSKRSAFIKRIKSRPLTFNAIDLVNKGEIEGMKLQILELILEIEFLLDLELKQKLIHKIIITSK